MYIVEAAKNPIIIRESSLSKDIKIENKSDLDDKKVKKIINKYYNNLLNDLKETINTLYDTWYKEPGIDISESEVFNIGKKLIDTIVFSKNSDGTYDLAYWINNYSSHPESKKFFQNHSMHKIYTIDDDGKLIKEYYLTM